MDQKRSDPAWGEAKKRCKLNDADIQMAKELGMTPKSLIKNILTSDQRWKAPVKEWVQDLYFEKFGKVLTVGSSAEKASTRKTKSQEKASPIEFWDDEDLPF